ncbi:nucleotidyltransferase domain-containing protein [Aquibacillus sp. 3ASR75-11]|uniref:Nucleotidyltransferase domain-containing protein n=1 Tax=Terrihalobacillus insolitus TaxID=2950438 RepID=A0A9X4AKM6_9BACI|nr:nucleotidyltransferase domain-containing protein [Terrihalobacillus insolitus]MDC3412313.1 nucleotidyltransferase domain-containing protein [Terrihalobacillus insolitus]MDC3422994.1 nucleotidyltransferase domain-containing protein [Terrihalobacillus insolitus]
MLTKKERNMIIEFSKEHLHASILYLFGSYATGLENPNSDIDLAYASNRSLSDSERFFLAQDLANILNKDVDLIDLRKANDVLSIQVLKNGLILYQSNSTERAYMEVVMMKKYARLNEERASFLEDFKSEGSSND